MFTIEQSFEHMGKCLANTHDMLKSVEISTQTDTLLMKRLAPDMYPLKEQLRLVCCYAADYIQELDAAKSRKMPAAMYHKSFLINASNALMIYSDLLQHVVALRQTPQLATNQKVTLVTNRRGDTGPPKITHTTAEDMFLNWTWPSMMFHQATAYAILRSAGFPLGKYIFLLAQRRYFGLDKR